MKASKRVLEEESGLTIVFEIDGKFYAPAIHQESVDVVRETIAQAVNYLVEVEMDISVKGEQK